MLSPGPFSDGAQGAAGVCGTCSPTSSSMFRFSRFFVAARPVVAPGAQRRRLFRSLKLFTHWRINDGSSIKRAPRALC